ncbi:hypothetical protein BY996DRAFT_6409431 [Phakopsora pachyrhizi]|nr:hypothetical protein BY996DRAFT_6409431 [Phakopsora pachyrhizi]
MPLSNPGVLVEATDTNLNPGNSLQVGPATAPPGGPTGKTDGKTTGGGPPGGTTAGGPPGGTTAGGPPGGTTAGGPPGVGGSKTSSLSPQQLQEICAPLLGKQGGTGKDGLKDGGKDGGKNTGPGVTSGGKEIKPPPGNKPGGDKKSSGVSLILKPTSEFGGSSTALMTIFVIATVFL